MQLEYKPDLEKVLERFEAWWACEIIDRPLVRMNIKGRREPEIPAKQHASLREWWFDVEYHVECFEARVKDTVYLAEKLPVFSPNLGPDQVATLFGCELEFADARTSWSTPIVKSSREILSLQPNFDNEYWTAIRRMTDLSLQRGAGRWLTGIADLHTNGDLVAALRDPQDLCLECADDIDAVRAACDYVTEFFPRMYEDLYGRIVAAGQPCTSWTPALHAGRFYMTSCDFICMISPEMLRKTIYPSLVREIEHLDRSMFHLDGPGALRHIEAILELPGLNGLQWVAGMGNGPYSRWIHVYQQAQAAGKCLQVTAEDFDIAKTIAAEIRPEGVWFEIYKQYTPEEADAFLKWLERWAAGKKV